MTPIPKGTITCVVRTGEDRKEILRSKTPEQTREDVVSGLHGMGVFRLDWIGEKWMLGHEFLTVDVDIERVTAPPEVPKEQAPAAEPSPPEELLPANLTDEIVSIHSRVRLIQNAIDSYAYIAVHEMKQRFGVAAPMVSREELVRAAERLRDLVIAIPELYLWTPPPPPSADNEDQECAFVGPTCYKNLRERLKSQSLIIIGGIPIPQRLDEVEKILGARPEWPETSQDSNSHVAESIERRMRDGKIVAVIIAHDLIRHRTFYAMRDAASAYGVPIAYASKAGIGKLRRALGQIEEMLKQDAELPF